MLKEKCPICRKASVKDFEPFCSQRCKLIDLNKWLTGAYYIPGSQEEDLEKDQKDQKDEETH